MSRARTTLNAGPEPRLHSMCCGGSSVGALLHAGPHSASCCFWLLVSAHLVMVYFFIIFTVS